MDGRTLTKAQARETVLTILGTARELIPDERPPELPGKENSEGVYIPGYHGFESPLWRCGADIWDLITAHPTLRGDTEVFDQIIAVVTNRAAMRGRQSFILACGSVKLARYAPQIAAQLDDPGVDGQALSTLYKMRADDYVEQVRPFVDSLSQFKRKEAKRYLAKFDTESAG